MKKVVALSALLMGLPLAANAGFYVGAGIGNATVESQSFIIDGEVAALNDNDMSFNINAGYDLTEHLAIDLAYQDWGKLSDNIAGQRTKSEIDMINVSLVGKLPLGDSFDLFGRVGVAFVNNDLSIDFVDSETDEVIQGPTDSVDSEDLIYGFGADWNVGAGFALRAEIDWVELSGFSKARNLSLSAIYNFDI